MKDSNVYIDLIIRACETIALFIDGFGYEEFAKDKKTQSAVIMQLHVIGEEAKKVDTASRSKINLPWEKIVALRNMISHEYFALELPLIWETSKTDIPSLATTLREYLRSIGTDVASLDNDAEPLM